MSDRDSDISEGELRRRLRRTISREFYNFSNDNSNTSSSSDVEMDQGEIQGWYNNNSSVVTKPHPKL